MDDNKFKEAMRQWVAGVTIVTTDDDGTLGGMTASSFTSVSINPHLILIAVKETAYTHDLIKNSGVFAANILNTQQVEWAKRFAGMYPEIEDRFFDIEYSTAETGSPILPDVMGWVDCKVYGSHQAGDHTIFVGQVLDAKGIGEGDPLLYYNRSWGQFAGITDS